MPILCTGHGRGGEVSKIGARKLLADWIRETYKQQIPLPTVYQAEKTATVLHRLKATHHLI